MKLNYKKTILIGLAFLSISSFWQMYDNIIPLILKNTFNLGETITGVIMASDNILALFLLPFFGALSDKELMAEKSDIPPSTVIMQNLSNRLSQSLYTSIIVFTPTT